MLFILVATVALGAGAAGVTLALRRVAPRVVPRWAAPVAAGVAMFAFTLWNEYSWYDRARAALPRDARIAATVEYAFWAQPWTLAVPRVVRFAAVVPTDGPAPPGMTRARVVLAERFRDVRAVPHLFDCEDGRRAPLPGEGVPDDPATLAWTDTGPGDPLTAAACNERAANEEETG